MFEQLLESTTAKKTRNPWAYAVSVTVQVIALGVLILIPLLYTEALPQQQMLSWLVAPPPPPPPPPPARPPRAPGGRVPGRAEGGRDGGGRGWQPSGRAPAAEAGGAQAHPGELGRARSQDDPPGGPDLSPAGQAGPHLRHGAAGSGQ